MNSNISLMFHLASLYPWIPVAMAGIYGALIGSFLNVVIFRVPVMLTHDKIDGGPGFNLAWPPSACPKCNNPIRARHNVPVLGWLALKGKCYDCNAPISARYPFVEVVTGSLMAATVWFSEHSPHISVVQTIFYLFYVSMLIAIAGIAFDTHKTHMVMAAPLLLVGLFFSVLGAGPGDFQLFANAITPEYSLFSACLGGALSYLLSLGIPGDAINTEQLQGIIGQRESANAEHMLIAALGAWLGWKTLLLLPPAACVIYFATTFIRTHAGKQLVRRPISASWAVTVAGIAATFTRF